MFGPMTSFRRLNTASKRTSLSDDSVRRVTTSALAAPSVEPIVNCLEHASEGLVHEMQLEAALHVTSFTAGQCMHMYGSAPDISANSKAPKEARTRRPPVRTPSERELEARLQKLREFSSMNGNRKDLAACLATPAEPVEEEEGHRPGQTSASQRSASACSAARCTSTAQSAASTQTYTFTTLLESERVRAARQRRRNMLRLVRVGRRAAMLLMLTQVWA